MIDYGYTYFFIRHAGRSRHVCFHDHGYAIVRFRDNVVGAVFSIIREDFPILFENIGFTELFR